ncbi:MAG: hypothetical protein ACYCUW_07965, partial [bacterium]
MAKHLSKRDIDAITNIILGWKDDKLSWDRICVSAEKIIGKIPTRQSLNANNKIKEAYLARKAGIKEKDDQTPKPSNLRTASDRITRLQNENDMLRKKNNALLEQFVVWQYNAHKYSIKERQLNEPLPRIDRE